jgi:fibronectin-binding autotransporter adhesin
VVNQTATINATLAGTQGFTKTGNGTLALTTVLPAGFGAIIDSAGRLTLSGANNYTAGTSLASGATLNFNNASAIGTGPLVINGGTLNNSTGAAITNSKNNLQTWAGDFAFTGTQNLNLGTGAVSLGANPGAARTLTVNAGTLTVGGIISNGTNGTTPTTGLIKAGNGQLTLSAANTFNGGITINAGTLRLSNASAAGGCSGGRCRCQSRRHFGRHRGH